MDLNIDYEKTITTGRQLVTKGGEFQDLLNRIKSINTDLQSYWEGSDASKYTEKVTEQAIAVQKLIDTVNEIGVFLEKVGNAYRDVAGNNTLQ